MGYKAPLLTTEFATISEHNRSGIAPNHCFAVGYAKEPDITAYEFFATNPPEEVRGFLQNLVATEHTMPADDQGSFIMFHASPFDKDDLNFINSKLPQLHCHVIAGPLSDEYEHIKTQKTYVPHPKEGELQALLDVLEFDNNVSSNNVNVIGYLLDHTKEAQKHSLIVHPGYTNLDDFTYNAKDTEIEIISAKLADEIWNLSQKGQGGARIIIDERFNSTGMLTIQVLGGEQLGQAPDPKHRWFDTPKAP